MLKKYFILPTLLSLFAFSTSILDAARIKSFKETLAIEENFSILIHPVFKQFASENPKQVIGLDQIDLDFISSIKTKYSGISDRDREKKITVHDDECVPQAMKVAKFIKIIDPEEKNVKIKDLFDEIDFMVAKKKVSPAWTLQLSARLAFAMSTPSQDELDLLTHVLDKNSRTQQKNAEDLLDVIQSILGYKTEVSINSDKYTDYPLHVWNDDMDRLFDTHPAIPLTEIIQPILGEGIISLAVLNALAAENVTLMGVPTEDKKVSAHGIKGHSDKPGASIAAFLSHDALHHLLIEENKRDAFFKHLHKKTDAAVENGDSAERFFEQYMPNATLRYQGIHTLLQLTMIGLMEDAIETKKLANFRKAMVGQFYMMHEYPGFTASTLDEKSASGVVRNLTDRTLKYFEDTSIWESNSDPLQTSPFDGSSQLSDKDIVESFMNQVNEEKISFTSLKRYSYLSSDWDESNRGNEPVPNIEAVPSIDQTDVAPITLSTTALPSGAQINEVASPIESIPTPAHSLIPLHKIFKTEVKRSARFIDVLIKMKDGTELTHSFPTYYHKWHNLDGTLGLLAYAGTKIEKPELPTNLEEAREVCSALLSKTTDLAKIQITHFVDQASKILNKVNTNLPGGSIEGAYKNWMTSLDNGFKEQVQPNLEPL
ncbi:MAG: hypothetical protein K2X53_01160 [Alphaproteobacteria bacterium]|nr:hypothetical protein [Alphaproteobacteria bacterium]